MASGKVCGLKLFLLYQKAGLFLDVTRLLVLKIPPGIKVASCWWSKCLNLDTKGENLLGEKADNYACVFP